MQFQHSLAQCEKMLKQLKKLAVLHGSWASFALEIGLEAEGGSREGLLFKVSVFSIQNFTFVFRPRFNLFSLATFPS